jgi:hypothetical protein
MHPLNLQCGAKRLIYICIHIHTFNDCGKEKLLFNCRCYSIVTVRPIDHSIAIWTAFALKPEVLNDKKKSRYWIKIFKCSLLENLLRVLTAKV